MTKKVHRHSPGAWRHVSGLRVARLAWPFIPYWLRHVSRQPYRRLLGPNPQPVSFRIRGRIAAYDSVMNLVVDAYDQLAGHQLQELSGTLVIVFNRVVGAFDDEFERRIESGQPLNFDGILNSSCVRGRFEALREFLRPYSTGPAIGEFLDDWVAKQ
jgi:hypothetical protein